MTDAPSDRTRVHGRIHPRQMLVAPVSGRRCVGHRVWGRVGKRSFDESVVMPFDLTLVGGRRARIDEKAELVASFHEGDGELRYRSAWMHPWAMPLFGRVFRSSRLPARIEEFLRGVGVDEPGAGVLYELALEPGMGALVEARLKEPRARGYRDTRPVFTLSESEDGAPVVIRSRDAPPGT